MALERGSDVWFEEGPESLVPEGYTCPGCGAAPSTFRKETDILDVWFDSGVSWAAVLGAKMGVAEVADLYLEGSDQHRGWFNSSLLTASVTRDKAPYKTVLTHGFVMDENGHKYSKSSKNFVPPEKMINVDGAEILRLWVAAVDYRHDMALSPQILGTVKDAYRKLRNTWRFLLGNLCDFEPAKHPLANAKLDSLDRWALGRLQQVIQRVREAYDSYEFHAVYHTMVRFATVDMSALYLNILKDRLYADGKEDPARRGSQAVLYAILSATVRLMAPILAFTSEEVWGHMPHEDSDPEFVHLATLPDADLALVDEPLMATFETLLAVRSEVDRQIESLRAGKVVGSSEQVDVVVRAKGAELAALRTIESDWPSFFIVASVDVVEGDVPEDNTGARNADVVVSVAATSWPRCARCRRCFESLVDDENQPELCTRCHGVVAAES